jgi:hypothetical protein
MTPGKRQQQGSRAETCISIDAGTAIERSINGVLGTRRLVPCTGVRGSVRQSQSGVVRDRHTRCSRDIHGLLASLFFVLPILCTEFSVLNQRSDQIRPDQTRSDQIRPDQTRSDQIRPD